GRGQMRRRGNPEGEGGPPGGRCGADLGWHGRLGATPARRLSRPPGPAAPGIPRLARTAEDAIPARYQGQAEPAPRARRGSRPGAGAAASGAWENEDDAGASAGLRGPREEGRAPPRGSLNFA